LSAAALLLACAGIVKAQNPPPGWKGKITVKDGVRTGLNPDAPLCGEVDLELLGYRVKNWEALNPGRS